MFRRAILFAFLSWTASDAVTAVQPPGVFRWAGDPEGGAPFVQADPSRLDTVVGFDVEVAALMARGLGRTPEFLNITFTSIDQSIARGDADIGMSGIEDTPARRTTMAVTLPYYEFREVLSVRDADVAAPSIARRPARQDRRHAGRHDCVRHSAARGAPTTE